MSVNKVILIGNCGKDPIVRSTQDGREIINLSLATSESWKDKATGERKSSTQWHNIVIFNSGLVGIVKQYVRRGSKLYIEGSLQTRKWQDKEGKDCYSTEVVLAAFGGALKLLDRSDKGENQDVHKAEYNQEVSELDDEIPF